MIFDPYLEWLGFRTRRPVAGVHITSSHVTVVALRRRPLRLVAVGRRSVPDAAVVDGDIRLVEPLIAALRSLVEHMRIGPGTPTVAVVEPLRETPSMAITANAPVVCDVPGRAYDAIVQVVNGAGLQLRTVDVVPAALARVGRQPAPATGVPHVIVPHELRPAFEPRRDRVAVGGALALFGVGPLVTARPAPASTGSGWTVQPVTTVARPGSDTNREPNRTPPTHQKAKEQS